ncbi:hypothetical protein [Marinilabilia salmonicolor]|uniref:hypothetical protein n=1 Tax=Marinilabilia salmonicolor TaxID=989 RepID=UPI00029AC158|nr:hypothetical protein [Marinilabilia salmonicolor]
MDLQTAKTNVMQKIMNVSKSSLLEKIGNILDEEMIIGMSLKGANMSNPGQSVQSTMTPGESSPLAHVRLCLRGQRYSNSPLPGI